MATARTRVLLLPILAALAGAPSAAAESAAAAQQPAAEPPDSRLVFPEGRSASYGEVYQHEVVGHRFVFENRSAEPVEILGTTAMLATGRIEVEPETVPPGGRGEVRIEQPVGDRLGAVTFRFGLRTDDPALPEPKLTLGGFVQSAYEPEVGRVDLGRIDRAQGGSARFELSSRETDRLGPVTIVDGPPWLILTARGEEDGGQRLDLELAVAPGAPLGYHFRRVLLKTAVPPQPDYVLEVRAAVDGDVVPSEAPIDLGLLRQGHRFEKEITLRSRSGAPVEVVALDPAGLRVALSPCPGPPTLDCRLLTLSGTPEAQGSLDGTIQVHVAGQPEPIPLTYSAIVASKDAVVRDLGPLVEGTVVRSDGTILKPDAPPPSPSPSPVSAPSPGNEAADPPEGGRSAPPSPEAAAPPRPDGPPEVTLNWTVRRQQRAYGFLVYRSENREGPFVRVTPEIVRAHDDGGAPSRYRWTDRDVEPGKTYFYYLDTVARSGLKQRLTAVQSKTVPAAPAAPAP